MAVQSDFRHSFSGHFTFYKHDTLETPEIRMRLLQVLPGEHGTPVQLRLSVHTLPDISSAGHTKYRCLSYMWGSETAGRVVLIDDHHLIVQNNLYDFLVQARREFSMEYIWVDAVCIDQQSTAEKNIQVSSMGLIYSKATEVLVWLGSEPRVEQIEEIWFQEPYQYLDEIVTVADALYLSKYWSRAWVTQELMLAWSMRVLFVTQNRLWNVSWNLLWSESWGLVSKRNDSGLPFNFRSYLDKHFEKEEDHFWARDLWLFLRRRGDTACTLLCDRIFALLSLVAGGHTFRVSYQEGSVELFWRAGQHFQAWSHVKNMTTLKKQLELTHESISRKSVPWYDQDYSAQLCFQIKHAHAHKYRCNQPMRSQCRFCKQAFPHEESYDTIMCTETASYRGDCAHLLVWRTAESTATRDFPIRLFSTARSTPYEILGSNLRFKTDDSEWRQIDSRKELRKLLRTKNYSVISNHWMVHVPRAYMLHTLQQAER